MRPFFIIIGGISASILLIYACNLVYREIEPVLRDSDPYRCGIFQSELPADVAEQTKEVYPDLGVVLANATTLQLSDGKRKQIESMAKECHTICSLQKMEIHRKEKQIKIDLAAGKFRNNLDLLSRELNELNKMKKDWLRGHRTRYDRGVALLNPEELKIWIYIESGMKPFPRGTR